ncbi:MmgE/PrpD family protein [Xylophilus sp. GW821-FHT01B05]
MGAQIACRNMQAPKIARAFALKYGRPGKPTLVGTALRLVAKSAGFANGTAGHSFEIDDYSYGAFTHPGCVVVAPALAIGEERGAGGAQVLCAVAVGFEAATRIALATQPSLLLDRGFHETSVHGSFASALACCALEQLDATTTAHALAVAGSHACGTVEYARSGGEVKRVHAGIGVVDGIRSTRLAQMGLSGPPTIFEGKRGFLQAFCNTHDARYSMPTSARAGAFQSMRPSRCPRPWAVCMPRSPRTTTSWRSIPSQRSTSSPSCWASIRWRPCTAARSAIADRVRIEPGDESVRQFPKDSIARVTVQLKSGASFSATGYSLGTLKNSLGRSGIEAKFLDLVRPELGDEVARNIAVMVMALEGLDDIRQLFALLAAE